jgi:CheY-like chemotaxis protein
LNEIVSRRILVVDDELLIAMDMEQMLVDLGAEVVGPATTLNSALQLATTEQIDCAVLDVNLGDNVSVGPVVDALRARQIPFVLATGYRKNAPITLSKSYPWISKPFTRDAIECALRAALESQTNA